MLIYVVTDSFGYGTYGVPSLALFCTLGEARTHMRNVINEVFDDELADEIRAVAGKGPRPYQRAEVLAKVDGLKHGYLPQPVPLDENRVLALHVEATSGLRRR